MDQSIQSYLKPELDEASKVLLRAADYIEKWGWCQYDLRDARGRVCLMGAIYSVAGEQGLMKDAIEKTLFAFNSFADGPLPSTWDDAPGRTKEEVCAKLRSVALGGA